MKSVEELEVESREDVKETYDDWFDRLDDVRRQYDLPEDYVLYVGTIEPRKNILRTARALDRLLAEGRIDEKVMFLVVGSKGWFYDEILKGLEELPHRDNIRLVGSVFGENLSLFRTSHTSSANALFVSVNLTFYLAAAVAET